MHRAPTMSPKGCIFGQHLRTPPAPCADNHPMFPSFPVIVFSFFNKLFKGKNLTKPPKCKRLDYQKPSTWRRQSIATLETDTTSLKTQRWRPRGEVPLWQRQLSFHQIPPFPFPLVTDRLYFLLNSLGWHWLIKAYRFPVYKPIKHRLHTASCTCHSKPGLFLSPLIPPLSPPTSPTLFSPVTARLSMSMSSIPVSFA